MPNDEHVLQLRTLLRSSAEMAALPTTGLRQLLKHLPEQLRLL